PWLANPSAPDAPPPEPPDLVLITHAHGDHLGDCAALCRSSDTEVVAIHEVQQYLLGKGLPNVTGMNIGGTYTTKGVTLTMVPALHSSSIQEDDRIICGGAAAGFVIRLEGGTALYHAGDTALFGDMALIGELYRPEVAMIPIGSHYVMGPKEAAHACRLIRPRTAIPMHFGTFPVLTGTVAAFDAALREIAPNVRMTALAPGETLSF
ncbi:metal-dependent hydrolase, partial [Dissulfurirhabdus thermomarina]